MSFTELSARSVACVSLSRAACRRCVVEPGADRVHVGALGKHASALPLGSATTPERRRWTRVLFTVAGVKGTLETTTPRFAH
jgi:hypothetical protein